MREPGVYIKIINPKKDGKKKYNNSGSCIPLVKYLSKEDKEKGLERELYFTGNRDMVTSKEVVQAIDQNSPKITKGEARFFSLVIAPHPQEMEHLKSDKAELKNYAKQVMNIYASTFNGKNGNNKNLKESDLVWYGKVEYNRYYEGTDPQVKAGMAKQGDPIPGDNTHIHIIVSRQDKERNMKLSPLVNSKLLFHREAFKMKSCQFFDTQYGYQGAGKDLEKLIIMRDGTVQERMAYLEKQDQKRISKPTQQEQNIPQVKQSQQEETYRKSGKRTSSGGL